VETFCLRLNMFPEMVVTVISRSCLPESRDRLPPVRNFERGCRGLGDNRPCRCREFSVPLAKRSVFLSGVRSRSCLRRHGPFFHTRGVTRLHTTCTQSLPSSLPLLSFFFSRRFMGFASSTSTEALHSSRPYFSLSSMLFGRIVPSAQLGSISDRIC